MTGLNLESFLQLLRADLGAWATLVLIAVLLAFMAWTSWGSRRALRKCLVLSVVAHVGLALYGGTVPGVFLALRPSEAEAANRERIRQIKVVTASKPDDSSRGKGSEHGPDRADSGTASAGFAPWDKPMGGLALADVKLAAPKDREEIAAPPIRPGARAGLESLVTEPAGAAPAPPPPEPRPQKSAPDKEDAPTLARIGPPSESEVPPAVVAPRTEADASGPRTAPSRLRAVAPDPVQDSMVASRRTENPLSLPDSIATPPASTNEKPPSAMQAGGEPAPPAAAEVGTADVAPVDVIPARPNSPRLGAGDMSLRTRTRPGSGSGGGAGPGTPATSRDRPASNPPGAVPATPPERDIRGQSRPQAGSDLNGALMASRSTAGASPLVLPRVTPNGVSALPEIQGAAGGRPLADIPEVYRSRLDPNRSARAFRAGATSTSEQAVERALDWLARHQDTDGRWDGATAKYDDGTAVKGDDDFTVHCPPGEACFGECIYWEADTALTGLALLAYLGAGYTQTDGKYAESVGKGLSFLLAQQKPDGDLRGRSRAVGIYCHAMATIALCEAYALTGDERLRAPVERAVQFLSRARARDGLAWRYVPGAAVGDTSILGWVVMALKSAREVGIPVASTLQSGTMTWLEKVSAGQSGGLARYQPWDNVTATMTAEAWVCRQFLGVGGPGPASTEAADYLLAHGPRSDTYNLYYWYYGTLAMYQHGGDAWYRWNALVRDEIVRRQRQSGHATGSWDPDDSPYGAKGGRIYCTALATLSLEVYYRYLRLYDEPQIPPAVAPRRPRGGVRDPAVGRLEDRRPIPPGWLGSR
jgi:hypothetical protein